MILVDCHCHLDLMDDAEEAVRRAEDAGVRAIISNGGNAASNHKTLELARSHSIVKPALGLYPVDILERAEDDGGYPFTNEEKDIDQQLRMIEDSIKDIVAIGEVGLDYKHAEEEEDKEKQRSVFRRVIDLAIKHRKPLIVHSRKAEADCIRMLDDVPKHLVVMHCFSGKKRLLMEGIGKGWMFTVPTNVVRSQQFQTMVELLPLSQLLTETDAPFLSPFRDTPNEPAFIRESIREIARIKQMEENEVANIIYMNYQRTFM